MTRTEWEQQAAQDRLKVEAAREEDDEESAAFWDGKARMAEAMAPYGTDGDAEDKEQKP